MKVVRMRGNAEMTEGGAEGGRKWAKAQGSRYGGERSNSGCFAGAGNS